MISYKKTREDKRKQEKTREDKRRQEKTREDKRRQEKTSGRQNRGNIFFPTSPLLFLTSPLHVLIHNIMICLQAGDEETSLAESELNGAIKSSRWCGLTVSGSFIRRAETTLVIRICIIMTGEGYRMLCSNPLQ